MKIVTHHQANIKTTGEATIETASCLEHPLIIQIGTNDVLCIADDSGGMLAITGPTTGQPTTVKLAPEFEYVAEAEQDFRLTLCAEQRLVVTTPTHEVTIYAGNSTLVVHEIKKEVKHESK